MRKKKSFTLIELLMVIAIMGILAATIIVSLNSAKKKARDAIIRTDLGQVSKLTQLWLDGHDNLDGFCANASNPNTELGRLIEDIKNNGGSASVCSAKNEDFAVSSSLNNPGISWCVDNNSSDYGVAISGSTSCFPSASNPPQPSNFSYFYIMQGDINLTSAQSDFLVTHYNYVLIKGWVSPSKVDKLHQAAAGKNSKFKILKYTDGLFSLSYKPPENSPAYAHNQNSTDSNKRIAEVQYNQGWYLMNPCSQEWKDAYLQGAKTDINQTHADGVFVDDMGTAGNVSASTKINLKPEKSPGTLYSDNEWYQCGGQFLNYIKNNSEGKLVVFNGLYHHLPPYTEKEYLGVTDGGMREGWITRDYVNFLDENLWKGMLDNAIRDLNQYGSNFVPLCIFTDTNATVNDALYCFTSYLLVNNDRVHYGPPKGQNGAISLYYRPELSINIGTPTQTEANLDGYKDPNNPLLYKRDYSGGKVVVNPSTGSVVYNLEKEYYQVQPSGSGLVSGSGTVDAKIDYIKVNGNITIAPQTGIILMPIQ